MVCILEKTQIGFEFRDSFTLGPSVSDRDKTCVSASGDGTRPESFKWALAAINYSDSDVKGLGGLPRTFLSTR